MGSKQVVMVGGEDKLQITAVLGCSAAGVLCKPQLVFKVQIVCRNDFMHWSLCCLHVNGPAVLYNYYNACMCWFQGWHACMHVLHGLLMLHVPCK